MCIRDSYTTANDASTSDLLLEFVGHSYWNDPGKDQDSITTLRFKGGGTTLRTFQGNGEAYFIGSQSQPSEFIIQQSQVSISPTDTRKRFHVFAGFGNYSNGSSVIVKCNSFIYIGIGGVNPNNYPAISSQAQIVITPVKIFTADYSIDLRTIGPQSIKIAPPTDNTEASITFYRYNDERTNVSGDYWVMGHGAFGVGGGGFAIGTWDLGPCLTIGTDGAVSFPRSRSKTLSLNTQGTLTQCYRLGTLNLPQGGHQAVLTINLCYGYNVGDNVNSSKVKVTNYQLSINLYSSNGSSSVIVDPLTYTGNPPSSGIYHHGFVQCTSPYISPLACYLGLTSDPQNKVDVWVQSYQYHGKPLIQVSQSAGSFDPTTTQTLPAMASSNGAVRLDMITNLPTFLYKNSNRL